MTNDKHNTRESWLVAMSRRIVPIIEQHAEGRTMPSYRVSCGWPARSGLARKHRRIGECWVAGGAHKEVFVSPTLSDSVRVCDVLAHELCHAILPAGTGHKAPFARLARAIGLEGKPTATTASADLVATFRRWIEEEGPYPHGAIEATTLPKQTTRMRKVACPACGYTLRATRTWLAIGTPTCPCGTPMHAADDGTEDPEPIRLVEQVTEYATEDGRFGIRRYTAKGAAVRWDLVDFEPEDGGTARLGGQFDSRQALLDRIRDMRAGLVTLPPRDEHDEPWDDEDHDPADEDDPLEPVLADDEEERPDYPEDMPEDPEEYEAVSRAREESGRRKSERIAGGDDAPLD